MKLIAYVVMPNHLHLAIQQHAQPIDALVHPILVRVAKAVRRRHKVTGHIFERRYWSQRCADESYVRTCVGYIHRNPVKASLCDQEDEYEWSSAVNYAHGCSRSPVVVEPLQSIVTNPLSVPIGVGVRSVVRPTRYIGDVVFHVLRKYQPPITVEILRAARGHYAAEIRRECVTAALDAGYRNVQIARYLNISQAVVSRIAVVVRRNRLLRDAWDD
jgi:hypothetical protein